MYDVLRGSQQQVEEKPKAVKTTNKYVEQFERLLCAGAYKQLKERKDKGITEGVISHFSPNNVRRVILGLDGIYVQFYVSPVNFKKKEQMMPITFSEQLAQELCIIETKSTPVTKVLRGDIRSLFGSRVFSSLEEIIVLGTSPEVSGLQFENHGLDWFLDPSRKQTVESSFKRLRAVGLVEEAVSCKDFVESHREILNDPYGLVLKDTQFGFIGSTFNDALYYTRTALRPQYYEMDEEGGILWTYFKELKLGAPSKKVVEVAPVKEVSVETSASDLRLIDNFFGLVHTLEKYSSSILSDFPTLSETLKVSELNNDLAAEYKKLLISYAKDHREVVNTILPQITVSDDKTYLQAVSVATYAHKKREGAGDLSGVSSVFVGFMTALSTCLSLEVPELLLEYMSSDFVAEYDRGLAIYFEKKQGEAVSTESDSAEVEEVEDLDETKEEYQGIYNLLVGFGFNLEGVEFKALEGDFDLAESALLPECTFSNFGEVSPLFAIIGESVLTVSGSFEDYFEEATFFRLACAFKELGVSDNEALKLASFGIFGLSHPKSVFEGYNEFVSKHSKMKKDFSLLETYFMNEDKGSDLKQVRPSFKQFAERFSNEVAEELLGADSLLAVDVLNSAYNFNDWGLTLPPISKLPKLASLLDDLVCSARVSYRFRRDFEKYEEGLVSDRYLSSKQLTKEGDYLHSVIDPSHFVGIMVQVFSYNPPSEVRDISGVFQKALNLVEKKGAESSE